MVRLKRAEGGGEMAKDWSLNKYLADQGDQDPLEEKLGKVRCEESRKNQNSHLLDRIALCRLNGRQCGSMVGGEKGLSKYRGPSQAQLVGLQTGSWDLQYWRLKHPEPAQAHGNARPGTGGPAANGRGRGSSSEREWGSSAERFRRGGSEVVGPKSRYIDAGVAERGVGTARLPRW